MEKRLVSILLIVVLAVSWVLPVAAADSAFNGQVAQRIAQLEEKYDIRIAHVLDANGDSAVDLADLYALDVSLGYVTPAIVRQVSAHFQTNYGRKLTFAFVYPPSNPEYSVIEVVGAFAKEYAQVNLYIPSTSRGTIITGAAPLTIVHEFGHALHTMCQEVLGAEAVESQWRAYNGDVGYTGQYLVEMYNPKVFVSSYGATSYSEDFAEVFSHAFVRNKAGQGLSNHLQTDSGGITPLGNKVQYVESLLRQVFTGTDTAIGNLRRIYSTSPVLVYQGMMMSGEDLQFIDFYPPRYVLRGIERFNGLEESSSQWISEIGAWQVQTVNGNYYLIFPGGSVFDLPQRLQAAA